MKSFICAILLSNLSLNAISQIPTFGLVAYYPFNNNTLDSVGTRDGIPAGIPMFGIDRFGNPNACYDVIDNSNYVNLPADVWLNGDYTISSWIKVKVITDWARLFDFGNGYLIDDVVGKISNSGVSNPTMEYYINSLSGTYLISPSILSVNVWYNIVYLQQGNTSKIYINNMIAGINMNTIPPQNVLRTQNKIGGSNAPLNDATKAYIDDFRIYNRALNLDEIKSIYSEAPYTLSLTDFSVKNNIQIFPNPSTGVYWVVGNSFPLRRIGVYNIQGEKVYSNSKIENQKSEIDLSSEPAGIYFLIASSNEGIVSKKLILQ